MKKEFLLTSLLCLSFFIAKADSWKIFKPNFTYANSTLSMGGRLPQGLIHSKAFRVADGKTILTVPNGYPITIDRNGTISSEHESDFKSLNYTFSAFCSVVMDATGTYYFQNTNTIAYYDVSVKKWLGINVRTGQTTGAIPALQLDNVFGITFNNNNQLFVAGTKDGLPVFAVLREKEWELVLVENTGMFPENMPVDKQTLKTEEFNINMNKNILDSYVMTSPVLSDDGSIWMSLGCSKSKGLLQFNDGNLQHYGIELLSGPVTDCNGNVLFATKTGIQIIKAGSANPELLIDEKATALFADKDALWYTFPVITEGLLPNKKSVYLRRYDFTTKKIKDYDSTNSPFGNTIKKISGDVTGNAVFQTDFALYTLDKSDLSRYAGKWTQYSKGYLDTEDFLKMNVENINKNGKYPVTVSCDQKYNRLVGVYENSQWKYYKMAVDKEAGLGLGMEGTFPNCACYTSKGILIGTYNDGVMLFDPSTEEATNIESYDLKKFGKNVRDIKEDKNGTIWIGTNKGLLTYDGSNFSLFDKKKSDFKSDRVNCLHITPNNVVWVGTGGDGVFSFDGSNWAAYTKKEGLKGTNIASLTGLGEVVYFSDQNTFRVSNKLMSVKDGKVSNEELPFYIAKRALDTDDKGNLWIIGNKKAIVCRKADGSVKEYNQANSPLGNNSTDPGVYSMNGYVFDGKLYMMSFYEPLRGVKDPNYKRPEGSAPFTKAPIEQLAEEYREKANTFDGVLISRMEIE